MTPKAGCHVVLIVSIVLLLSASTVGQGIELDAIAEAYVRLTLKVGLYDPDYVDYYYGPEEWKITDTTEIEDKYPLVSLGGEAEALMKRLDAIPESREKFSRKRFLSGHLEAVKTYINILQGNAIPFAEECRKLYDISLPACNYEYADSLLGELDRILPGEGDAGARLRHYLSQYSISGELTEAAFETALDRARSITAQHLDLPPDERLSIEYVHNKPWGGFCTFLGNSHSLVQLNVDNPKKIYGLLDVACHEAYPGHHTNLLLIEKHLARDSGWVEHTIGPLYTPSAVLCEGTACFALDMILPLQDRIKFAREVLFPIAEFDTAEVDRLAAVTELRNKIWRVEMDVARRYLDGDIDSMTAARALQEYMGLTDYEAQRNISFYSTYRSYIVTYYIGYDLIEDYLARTVAEDGNILSRWDRYAELLRSPVMPSDLAVP